MHGLIRDIHDQRWRRNFENFNFLRGFLVCFVHYGYAKCEIMYHRLVLYLNMYYHLPFSCGTLLKSKNWFDVLNFRFSQLHDYSGYTIIRDSRVEGRSNTIIEDRSQQHQRSNREINFMPFSDKLVLSRRSGQLRRGRGMHSLLILETLRRIFITRAFPLLLESSKVTISISFFST